VTEHIDMFALPVDAKRILLASYDLSKPFAAEYWSKLSDAERDLALNAALAMQLDTERLRNLGYDIVPVPSPFPRIPPNGHIYYPSILNTLIRTSGDGHKQALVPSYKDYETDVQSAALQQIAAAFGPKTEIVTIEATEAAKSQGAIHCLTLTAPLRLSVFADPADAARRAELFVRKEQLDRTLAAEIASQIPATGLRGSWVVASDQSAEEAPLELYPERIFFNDSEFQKGVFDTLESQGKYSIDKKDSTSWFLHFVFPDQDITTAVAHWISKDEVQLTVGEGDRPLTLRRIDSSEESPFISGEQGPARAGEGTGLSGRKHPKRGKPATPSGQASGSPQTNAAKSQLF
jgi:Porphyromonas-type peptidyl-arginine deiminase